jgi:hypothetical protein
MKKYRRAKELVDLPSKAPPAGKTEQNEPMHVSTRAGRGVKGTVPTEVCEEFADIEDTTEEPADVNVVNKPKVVIANITDIENAVFNGAFRAQARFEEPVDEVDIEKIHRLKMDGWKWKDIVREFNPACPDNLLDSEVKRLSEQHRREYGN